MAMYFGSKNKTKKGPAFPVVKEPGKVSVSPGKGGVNIGTLTRCASKRAKSNVKSTY
jgi:hypothetical protein